MKKHDTDKTYDLFDYDRVQQLLLIAEKAAVHKPLLSAVYGEVMAELADINLAVSTARAEQAAEAKAEADAEAAQAAAEEAAKNEKETANVT